MFIEYGCFDREEMYEKSQGNWKKNFQSATEFGMNRPETEFLKFMLQDDFIELDFTKRGALRRKTVLDYKFFEKVKSKLGAKPSAKKTEEHILSMQFMIKVTGIRKKSFI